MHKELSSINKMKPTELDSLYSFCQVNDFFFLRDLKNKRQDLDVWLMAQLDCNLFTIYILYFQYNWLFSLCYKKLFGCFLCVIRSCPQTHKPVVQTD